MTNDQSSEARRSRTLFYVSATCLAVTWIGAILAPVLGVRVSSPIWLMLGGGVAGFASSAMQPARPRASEFLVVLMAALHVSAVIVLVLFGG
jgi:predicted MFS family arabinose efflux permease